MQQFLTIEFLFLVIGLILIIIQVLKDIKRI